MGLNASGIRDTARVLRLSTDTVLSELKKKEVVLESVNTALLRTLTPEQVVVHLEQAGEAEMDEMWSFVGNKGNPRWLWHAIDHHTGAVLAYVFGRRKDEVFLRLKALLEPFGRSCAWALRVIPAVQNPVQCPFYHLCEGAVRWYPLSFSTR